MFQAEADGLVELRAAGEIRVPEVVDVGCMNGQAYIDLERLELEQPTHGIEKRFGEQLAALHRHARERYGWHRDNTIGPTPQHNDLVDDWVGFFREQRIGYQVRLALRNGYSADLGELGERVLQRLPELFANHRPAPSLLHGDLWGGNWGVADGEAVIFDPAVYYGDRETDIAMTMLFGGFSSAFYESYEASWPLPQGHERRIKLYQLYHILNHLNIFGRSYLARSMQLLRELA